MQYHDEKIIIQLDYECFSRSYKIWVGEQLMSAWIKMIPEDEATGILARAL